jgi:hypothetical protein
MTQTPYTASVPDDAPIQVRSHRRAQWFWLDNALIDTHAQAIGPIAVALYVGLCRYANAKTGQCWPSLVRLSQQLGMTRLTARRYLQVLVAHRLIQVEARPGTTTLVTILEMPDGELPAPSGGEEDGQAVTRGGYDVTRGDGQAVTRGGYDVTRGWLPGDHEPDLLNQTQEPDPPNPPEEAYAPREKKPLDQPAPLPPLSDRPDDALGALGLDVETRTQLYDRARAALVAEGVSPWHLIQPAIECRMLAIWEAQTLTPGVSLDPQPELAPGVTRGQAEASGWHQGRAA